MRLPGAETPCLLSDQAGSRLPPRVPSTSIVGRSRLPPSGTISQNREASLPPRRFPPLPPVPLSLPRGISRLSPLTVPFLPGSFLRRSLRAGLLVTDSLSFAPAEGVLIFLSPLKDASTG